jgi:type II secretory pathway predicted ATPase ExeA
LDIFCTYQQHFGLSGPPFTATPDPDFYFESRGHHRAFAFLEYAVLEGDCLIVLTGDAGTGKTMLVTKLLGEIEASTIAAAAVTATPLDAAGALRAVLSAFHAPFTGRSLEVLRTEVQTFLHALSTAGRRGLIVVDEAQQLLPNAIEELIRLTKPQPSDGVPLQVLLAGQPGLRTKLTTMTRVAREPFFLFCDVGPLSSDETRAYIEHRLRHVRWNQSPSFDDDAYRRIHQATGGVPLAINRLCHRLLIAASKRQHNAISEDLVEQVLSGDNEDAGDTVTPRETALAAEPAIQQPLPAALPGMRWSRNAIPTLIMAVDDHLRLVDVTVSPGAVHPPAVTAHTTHDASPLAMPTNPEYACLQMLRAEVNGLRLLGVTAAFLIIAWYVAGPIVDDYLPKQESVPAVPAETTPTTSDDVRGSDAAAEAPVTTSAPTAGPTASAPAEASARESTSQAAAAASVREPTAQATNAASARESRAQTTTDASAPQTARETAAPQAQESARPTPNIVKSEKPRSDRRAVAGKEPARRIAPREPAAAGSPPPRSAKGVEQCTPAINALGLCTPAGKN